VGRTVDALDAGVAQRAGPARRHYRFKVDSDNAANSGSASATRVSPKLSLIFGPWAKTELRERRQGFHSNDARGTVITVDPKSGEPIDKVTPLVRSQGHVELGLRSSLLPGLQSSLSLYRLDFDSELLFVGDAGTTEAGRPSRRTGFELANYYKLNDWLTIDADWPSPRRVSATMRPEGRRIPGAVEGVASIAWRSTTSAAGSAPAAALLRPAPAAGRQQRALEGQRGAERARRLQALAQAERRAGSLQPEQAQGLGDRLLLRLAPAGRGRPGRGRRAFPSDGIEVGSGGGDGTVLMRRRAPAVRRPSPLPRSG
jgi:hypothetical protein